jgi:hypothetical protein
VPGKCTTVIVVNWAEKGHSMTDRKFRVQSSLFRSLCVGGQIYTIGTGGADKHQNKLCNAVLECVQEELMNIFNWHQGNSNLRGVIIRSRHSLLFWRGGRAIKELFRESSGIQASNFIVLARDGQRTHLCHLSAPLLLLRSYGLSLGLVTRVISWAISCAICCKSQVRFHVCTVEATVDTKSHLRFAANCT